MKQEQGTQINASGDHAHIVNGDAVKQQHVGVQHVNAMYVAQPASPKIKPELLAPCPNECGAMNSRHSQRCRSCDFPIAERLAFLREKSKQCVAAVVWTVAAVTALVALYLHPVALSWPYDQVMLHRGVMLTCIAFAIAVWLQYWWRYARHA